MRRARLLAGSVATVHFGFVLFVIAGALVVAWKPWLAWLHIPCVLYGFGIEIVGGTCPLTTLENRLRVAGGKHDYGGSCVHFYAARAVDPARWARLEPWLGTLVLLTNLAVYGYLIGNRP